ncbi:MAG: amino acid ABC transporter permease [Pseudoclavibacter sp.]
MAELGTSAGESPRAVAPAPHLASRRPWLQWALSVLVTLLVVVVGVSAAGNDNLAWPVVAEYLFNPKILQGLWTTVYLSVTIMVIALVLGSALAVCRLFGNALLRRVAATYVWFFRSVPVLVQIVFWYNAGAIAQRVSLGIPFTDLGVSVATNDLVTPLSAAVLGLGLAHGAFASEYIRGSLISVQAGQILAGESLGMTGSTIFRVVILPQAIPIAIPSLGSEFVTILKATSLVSVIGLADVLYAAQVISAQNFQVIPLLIVASIWYLVLVSLFEALRHYLERRTRKWETR